MSYRPGGNREQDIARWYAHPERSTFFLEVLAKEKREGRFLRGNPTNAHYNLLIKRFWEDFQIYHTKAQLKNHFNRKRQLWKLAMWAQTVIGISWNHDQKMIIASPQWWESNKERKGLSSLKNKHIPDYDLLEEVFRGQHAEGLHLEDPLLPRRPAEEFGDCPAPKDVPPTDPEKFTPEDRESTTLCYNNRRKKSRVIPSSSFPDVQQLNHIMGGLFDRLDQRLEERRSQRRTDVSTTMESVMTARSNPITNFEEVILVLLEEMKMDVTSDMFLEAQDMFIENKHLRVVLLRQRADTRWPWLIKMLERRMMQVSTPSKYAPQARERGSGSN